MIASFIDKYDHCQLQIADCRLFPIGNWQVEIGNALVSSVWQHRYDAIMVRRGNEHIDIQLTLSLVSLLRQYVPRMRMAALDLTASRQPESLRCSFVCL